MTEEETMDAGALREALAKLGAERDRAHEAGEHEYERGLMFIWNDLVAAAREPVAPAEALRGALSDAVKRAGLYEIADAMASAILDGTFADATEEQVRHAVYELVASAALAQPPEPPPHPVWEGTGTCPYCGVFVPPALAQPPAPVSAAGADAAWEAYKGGKTWSKPTPTCRTEGEETHARHMMFVQGWTAAIRGTEASPLGTERLTVTFDHHIPTDSWSYIAGDTDVGAFETFEGALDDFTRTRFLRFPALRGQPSETPAAGDGEAGA